jgi:hypothetical protein
MPISLSSPPLTDNADQPLLCSLIMSGACGVTPSHDSVTSRRPGKLMRRYDYCIRNAPILSLTVPLPVPYNLARPAYHLALEAPLKTDKSKAGLCRPIVQQPELFRPANIERP